MIVAHYLTYLLLRTVESVLIFTPLRVCWYLGAGMGWMFRFVPHYRKLVRRNLQMALGDEMGRSECLRIERRHFVCLGRNIMCSLKIAQMSTAAAERRVRYENRQVMLDLIEQDAGMVCAFLHMGPWELHTQIPSIAPGLKKAALYQPLANPFINRHVLRSRTREGVTLFDRRKGFYGPMNHVREGGGLAVLVDQNAGSSGVWCPLFGRLASTTNLVSLLTIRTGTPILPIGLYPDGVAKWRIVYGDPIYPNGQDGKPIRSGKLTAELNLSIEKIIRRAPEEWFWVHNRWRTPVPEFLLSAYRRGIEYPEAITEAGLKPFRILIRSPNWLGDAGMAVPAVRGIKAGRPDAEVTVVCNENLADLWRRLRHVDRVIARPLDAGVNRTGKLIAEAGPFDVGVLFTNSLRTALEMRRAGVRPVVGYRGHNRSWLLDYEVPGRRVPGPPEHQAWRFMRIAHAVGADKSDPGIYATREHHPEESHGWWKIGICPGAAYGPAKRWPVERFARTVERVHRQMGGQVEWFVYGAPDEVELAQELEQNCAVRFEDNLVGKTSIGDLMGGLQKLHILITNDTGTMHISGLLGVPTVAIFGSTEPALSSPLGDQHRILRKHVECSPCFLRDCPLDFRCMNLIEVDEVVEAALALLEETKDAGKPVAERCGEPVLLAQDKQASRIATTAG